MNDSKLDDLLRTAKEPDFLPSSFPQDVWNRIRIAASDAPPEIVKFQPVVVAFARPWGAVTAIAAMVTLGLWLGATIGPDVKDGKLAYAESISPFAQAHRK